MTKKTMLTGPEIERLTGPADAATVALFVKSFRATATVANAAWKLLARMEATVPTDTHDALLELRAALQGYSPENFPTPPALQQRLTELLVEAYNDASAAPTKEAALEAVYRAIERVG